MFCSVFCSFLFRSFKPQGKAPNTNKHIHILIFFDSATQFLKVRDSSLGASFGSTTTHHEATSGLVRTEFSRQAKMKIHFSWPSSTLLHQGFHLFHIYGAWLKSHDGAKNLTPKERPESFFVHRSQELIYIMKCWRFKHERCFPHKLLLLDFGRASIS